jgi:hypothetical protein
MVLHSNTAFSLSRIYAFTKMKKYLIVIIIALVVVFAALKLRKAFQGEPSGQGTAMQQELPEDFQKFYQSFHQDSLFQISHIRFPLAGLPAMAAEELIYEGKYFYEKENWKLHRPFNLSDATYRQQFKIVDPDYLIIERIVEKKSGMGIERRFLKEEDRWLLIYYSAMNSLEQPK